MTPHHNEYAPPRGSGQPQIGRATLRPLAAAPFLLTALLLSALLLSASLLAPRPASAVEFTVNSTAEADDFDPGDGICETGAGNGICTVRAALQEVNQGAGGDTIDIPFGEYSLDSPLEITVPNVTVTGPGIGPSINRAVLTADCTLFRVLANNITIEGLELDGNSNTCFPLIEVGQESPTVIVTGVTITGNSLHDGDVGVEILEGSNGNTVSQNEIFNNITGGIVIKSASNNTIQNNTIHDNGAFGIAVELAETIIPTGNQILNNTISNTQGHGIRLQQADTNLISGNTITMSGLVGLAPTGAIELARGSDSNTVTDNNLKDNAGPGIKVGSENPAQARALNNILKNNAVLSSGGVGIQLNTRSEGTTVHRNTIIGNNPLVKDNGSSNVWHATVSSLDYGNFYGDYNANDANSDDIGDTPYTISGDANSSDPKPLMLPGPSGTTFLLASPSTGPAGQAVQLTGGGFSGVSSAQVTFDITVLGTVNPNANGAFRSNFNVPGGISGGLHTFTVSGSGKTAEASFLTPISVTVNSATDAIDATPGDGVCETALGNGVCPLRAAVQESNAAGGGTITLPAGVYTLSLTGADEDLGATGDLDITASVAINGAGAATTIIQGCDVAANSACTGIDRLLDILSGTVSISGVTLRRGNAPTAYGGAIYACTCVTLTISDSVLTENSSGAVSSGAGGALASNGTTTISNSTLSSNFSPMGGAVLNSGALTISGSVLTDNSSGTGPGGAVFSVGPLTITNSTLSGNHADGPAGALYYNGTGADFAVSGSTISNNTSGADGGGMYLALALSQGTISATTLTGNSASYGGGVFVSGGLLRLGTSTLSGNSATSDGGGIFVTGNDGDVLTVERTTLNANSATGSGGGLFIATSGSGNLAEVINSTLSGNSAATGGGIANFAGLLTLTSSTLSGNSGGGLDISADGEATVTGTILSAGTGNNCLVAGTLTSGGHNLSSDASCVTAFTQTGDLNNSSPLLGTLTNNGGLTQTHQLQAGSPAINTGGNTCPATDQRGQARPQGNACDIGAYEVLAGPDPSSVYAAAVLADSPAAYWRMGEATGAPPTAVDSSGQSNHGAYQGSVARGATGALSQDSDTAAAFTGGSIAAPDSVSLSPTAALSVEAWVYLTAYTGNYPRLISKPGAYELSLYTAAGQEGRLQWKLLIGAGGTVYDTETSGTYRLKLGQWYHVVATYDGTTARIFINGVERASKPVTGAVRDTSLGVAISPSDRPLGGKLDEVAVYGSALSANRILEHFTVDRPGGYPGAVLADNPFGYWRLAESSGTQVQDASRHGNHGVYVNGPTLGVAGAITDGNSAVRLDGTDDLATFPDAPTLSPTAALSVEVWIKLTSYSGSYPRLLSKPGAYELVLFTAAGQEGRLQWKLFTGPAGTVSDTDTTGAHRLRLGRWYHVVATYDGATARIYLDGIERASKSVSGAVRDTGAALTLGQSDRPLAASLDDVAIYGVALPAGRVQAHQQSGWPGTPPAGLTGYAAAVAADTPAGYWRLNETSGSQAVDLSGQQNHGVYVNGPTLGVAGALTGPDLAVGLDGTDDTISMADSAGLSPTAALSVEAWVYLDAYSGNYPRIVSKAGAYELVLFTAAGHEGRLQWKLFTGPAATLTDTQTAYAHRLLLGQWYHVVATYDGATARIYVNGAERASQSVSGAVRDTTGALTLSPADRRLNAKLDEVAVYGSALTAARVQAHYAAR